MKKIATLSLILLSFIFTKAQTITPDATSVTSGSTVILTASGENNASYFASISWLAGSTTVTPTGNAISITSLQEAGYSWATSGSPSKYSFVISTSATVSVTASITFRCVFFNKNGQPSVTEDRIITLTVTPAAPSVFYNDSKSQTFFKNDCGSGFESDPVTYTVPANKYSSTISKADANSKAQTEINANGQNKANTEGVCKQLYYNTEVSQSFIKNNCGDGFTGSTVLYIVTANKHKSLISQADANSKAANDLSSNGQSFANSSGYCTEERKRYFASKRSSACSSSGQVSLSLWIRVDKNLNNINQNNPSSQVFVYTSFDGDTKVPAGYYTILYPISGSQTGIHVFNVSSTGQITGYTPCSN